MSYLEPIFLENIDKSAVQTIFELGSRDLLDAHKLQDYYGCLVYAFECNPDCLEICDSVIETFNNDNIVLVKKAVSITDGPVSFYPFDLAQYDNMGASSLLKINFDNREEGDPDYKRVSPQTEIVVDGIRLDTFMSMLDTVKYIIVECSVESTYTGGTTFAELKDHLEKTGFKYVCSNRFEYELPDASLHGYSEFDALFTRR